jgi:hypothetical protein
MDKELINYIVTYHTNLLTDKEKLGLKHLRSEIKIGSSDNLDNKDSIERKTNLYKKNGWLTEDKEILELIKVDTQTLWPIGLAPWTVACKVTHFGRQKDFLKNESTNNER